MPARRFPAPALLAALGVSSLIAPGCQRTADPAQPRAAAPAVRRVVVVKPKRADVRRLTEQPGQVEAAETTPIYAKLGGYVETVAVDIGDKVKKGQVLAELRMPEIEADVKQKRAAVEQARAQKEQSASAVKVAEAGVETARAKVAEVQSGIRRSGADVRRWQSEFARVEQLVRDRALTGSLLDETRSKLHAAEAGHDEVQAQTQTATSSLDEATALLDKARADLEAATARIDVARAEAEHAEAMAGYLKIRAPFDGVVTRRSVDTGHLTTPGASGELLFVIVHSDLVTIRVDVPEVDAPFVRPGNPAIVRLQALGGRTFEGQVTRTAWSLDPGTRTLRTEIDLANPEDILQPGLYAYATIITGDHKNALTVPATAIIREGDRAFCMIVVDGHARRREVKLGLSDGSKIEIISGIDGEAQVVEANPGSLADGQAVEVAGPKS